MCVSPISYPSDGRNVGQKMLEHIKTFLMIPRVYTPFPERLVLTYNAHISAEPTAGASSGASEEGRDPIFEEGTVSTGKYDYHPSMDIASSHLRHCEFP